MDRFTFIPVCGLTGSGKSAHLDLLRADGQQVVSVEFLAGVTGVCLRNLSDQVITADELRHRLFSELEGFATSKPVYVEWKPELVHRVELPAEFVQAVRRSTAFVAVDSFANRLDRLMADYAPLLDHLDYVVEIFHRSGIFDENRMRLMRGFMVCDDARGMASYLLQHHFDPLYVSDLKKFDALAYGRFDPLGGGFLGTVLPRPPFDLDGWLLDGVMLDDALLTR